MQHPMPPRIPGRIAACLAALLVCLLSCPISARTAPAPLNVLFLSSYQAENKGSIRFKEGLLSIFASNESVSINIFSEYMDTTRFSREDNEQGLAEFYRSKYRDKKIDVIISHAAPALDFLLKHRDILSHDTPVVFALLADPDAQKRTLPPGYVGITAGPDFASTLDVALTLLPETENVLVVGGTSPVDRQYLATAQGQLTSFENRVKISYLNQIGMDGMLKHVATLPERTVIIYALIQKDGTDTLFSPEEAAAQIARAANAPVFALSETNMNTGLVGGRAMSLNMIGRASATTALSIIGNRKLTDAAPPPQPTHAYIFDWKALQRWHLDEERLQPGSIILNREFTFRERYRGQIIAVGILLLIETALIVLLLFNQTRRVRAEKILIESETRYRQIIQTTMDGFFRTDLAGRIIEVNEAYCRMSGYDDRELLCMGILDLDVSMPPDAFSAKMRHIIEKGNARFETRHRRKDGQICHIEVSVQPREEAGEIQFVSFMRDITRRKLREKVQTAKLRLVDFASAHSVMEFLQKFLDEAETLTDSRIGFFHFVEDDQEILSMQTWSTNTLKNMCTAEGSGTHYPINKAGVWADCVKRREPLIHNDYGSLPHKRGLPAGHAPVIRELVVPVIRNEKIVAILGVGNKPTDYNEIDIDTIREFADLTWETVILKRAEEERRESDEKYRSMMEAMHDAASICSSDFRIEYSNPAMIQRIGRNACGERCYHALHGLDHQCPWCAMDKIRQGEHTEADLQSPLDGRFYHISNSPIFHPDGSVSKLVIYRDVTQLKKVEQQLMQAQKLESVGNLAAGIAHDFNNVLFPIIGLAELLVEDLPAESFERENAVEIVKSAMRAADLVKQILTFSRQGNKKQVPIRIQQVLKEVYKLMRTTIPADIPLTQSIQQDCHPVMADPTQLHQIAMNLITNAYHAVEENGGKIFLGLRESVVAEDESSEMFLPPGEYAVISVSDTGKGIAPNVLGSIFEPYFSTKKAGKGTGLGLSVVYGIVKNHGGDIKILNEPGTGVCFDVYLPMIKNESEQNPATDMDEPLPTGSERILIVDDEESIVRLEKNILERLGYRVTAFTDCLKMKEVFTTDPDSYDLVVSDMTMPHMTGIQLAAALLSIRPDIPIIICTGFSERIDRKKAQSTGIKGLLMKPATQADLAHMVRKVLDGPSPEYLNFTSPQIY